MILKILFWLFVAIDVAALVLFGLLGLAAAKPSHTNPLVALIVPFVLPALVLTGSVWLFLRAQSTGGRVVALAIAALPFIFVVVSQGVVQLMMRGYQDEGGNFWQFRSGPLREIEAAIQRNDVAALTAAARGADVNKPGISGATALVLGFRQLEKTPEHGLDVVRALLKAGADPNAGKDELPLQPAIGLSRRFGPELVKLLLDAGANPNKRSEFGDPVFFIAGGADIDVEVMKLLLDRGADIKATNRDGHSAVHVPLLTRNWKVMLLLLQRGASWRNVRTPNDLPFRAYVENEARLGTGNGLAEVIEFLRAAEASGGR